MRAALLWGRPFHIKRPPMPTCLIIIRWPLPPVAKGRLLIGGALGAGDGTKISMALKAEPGSVAAIFR